MDNEIYDLVQELRREYIRMQNPIWRFLYWGKRMLENGARFVISFF
jgi:hypothetical protein